MNVGDDGTLRVVLPKPPDGDEAREDPAAEALERGRALYRERQWADAFDAFSLADKRAPLGPSDLASWSWCAGLVGRDDDMLRLCERLYHSHLESNDDDEAARWAFWLGFRLLSLGEPARANAWLARAQRLVDRDGVECVVQGYLLLPAIRKSLATRDYDAAYATATRALTIGEQFRERDLIAFARSSQGRILVRQGKLDDGLGLFDEVMLSATAGELSPVVAGLMYCAALECCHQVHALHRAREWTSAFSSWCDAQPQILLFAGNCRVYRAELLTLAGSWGEALEETGRASRSVPPFVQPAAAAAFYQEAEVHRLRGDVASAEAAYRSASDKGRDPQPGLALLRLAQGRVDVAETSIRRVVDGAIDPFERARLLPAFVEILLAAGDVARARVGATELDAIARSSDGGILRAAAAHAVGAVRLAEGDARGALAELRESFRVWHALDAPYVAAKIRVLASQACAALGDGEGAELELTAARETFVRLGAKADLAALDARDGALGSREPHGLTARELEVLRLLATGKTNKAIALELHLSEKTVDRHVSNLFVKTGVTSRSAATAFAYENGIVRSALPPRG